MKVGDLVTHKYYDGSIGVVVSSRIGNAWRVMWFKHYYDTGFVSPVYEFEVEVINESR